MPINQHIWRHIMNDYCTITNTYCYKLGTMYIYFIANNLWVFTLLAMSPTLDVVLEK